MLRVYSHAFSSWLFIYSPAVTLQNHSHVRKLLFLNIFMFRIVNMARRRILAVKSLFNILVVSRYNVERLTLTFFGFYFSFEDLNLLYHILFVFGISILRVSEIVIWVRW